MWRDSYNDPNKIRSLFNVKVTQNCWKWPRQYLNSWKATGGHFSTFKNDRADHFSYGVNFQRYTCRCGHIDHPILKRDMICFLVTSLLWDFLHISRHKISRLNTGSKKIQELIFSPHALHFETFRKLLLVSILTHAQFIIWARSMYEKILAYNSHCNKEATFFWTALVLD